EKQDYASSPRAAGEPELRIKDEVYVTPGGRPVLEHAAVRSGATVFSIEARFLPGRVRCDINDKGRKSTKTVAIPAGVVAGSDQLRLLHTGFHVGAGDSVYLFNGPDQTFAQTK